MPSKTMVTMFAAACAGTAGLLAVQVPAQAQPGAPFPLAPACTQWTYFDAALFLETDDGYRIGVPWNKGTGSVRQGNNDAAWLKVGDPDFVVHGSARGGVNPGNALEVTITWTDGTASYILGGFNELGVATGTVRNIDKGGIGHWSGGTPFTCEKFAAEPQPDPKAQAGANPEPQPAGTVKVLKKSDVFDGPDGNGQRLGPPTYFLAVGRTLTIAEPCRDNWCLLNVPDPEVPGGKGWVYSGEDFLDVT